MVIFKPGDKVLIQGPPMGMPGIRGEWGIVESTTNNAYRAWNVRIRGKGRAYEFQVGELHRFPKGRR